MDLQVGLHAAGGRRVRRHREAALAVAIICALACITACGSGTGGPPAPVDAGAAVHNTSDQKGGTLRFANPGDWDSLDPGNTYYNYSWNFVRLYGRSLVTFAAAPRAVGATLVPDLSESLGKPGDDARTWTYTLRPGLTFEDGSPITSKDVKYAVERSLDKKTFPNGPTYFNQYLDLGDYSSPYQDPDPERLGLKAIETPDDRTIVFRLNRPFSDFDYLAQLPATVPVPRAKDIGSRYQEHVVSSGPYMFERNDPGKGFVLVRNPNWDQATDPIRKALPDRIEVTLNVNADDVDNRLLSGDLDVDVAGAGVQPAAQGRILADPTLKANTDSALGARLWYTFINPDVAPLDNIHCRRAVLYAADRTGFQRAQGGPPGGDIATNLLPPVIPGSEQFDPYLSEGHQGDLDKARDELRQCGVPNGFTTNISYRTELPREEATAEALQQSLSRVGINLQLRPFPLADYTTLYAGKPDYAKANQLGLMNSGWAADWPDGFGFLSQIVDSRTIRPTGGNTNFGIKDKAVDAMIDQALATTDTTAREKLWVAIDRKVMEEAYILPGVWARGLLYRPPHLTNTFVTDGYQMYDYAALGTTRR